MNGIVKFRLCDLSNKELIKRVDHGTDNLYRTREVPPGHIPARPNEDYDLLVGELLCRFDDMIKNEDENNDGNKAADWQESKEEKVGNLALPLRQRI